MDSSLSLTQEWSTTPPLVILTHNWLCRRSGPTVAMDVIGSFDLSVGFSDGNGGGVSVALEADVTVARLFLTNVLLSGNIAGGTHTLVLHPLGGCCKILLLRLEQFGRLLYGR
jgi:hypothetical protein